MHARSRSLSPAWSRWSMGGVESGAWGGGPNLYTMRPGQDDGEERFRDFDLWLGLEGACEVRMLGHRIELRAGRLLLIPPGVRVQQRTGPGGSLRMLYVHFEGRVDGRPLRDAAALADASRLRLELPGIPALSLVADADTAGLAEKLLRLRAGPEDDIRELRMNVALWEILVKLREACRGDGLSPVRERLELAVAFLERNLHRRLTLREIAREVRVSPETLGRLFRAHGGASPMQYLERLRLARARELLQDRRHNVSEVARACGYASLAYFSRSFRRACGRSPREFRKRLPSIP